jgi:hypothetical protein
MIEEDVCPDSFSVRLRDRGDYAVARPHCSTLTLRFGGESDVTALQEKLAEMVGTDPPPPVASSSGRKSKPESFQASSGRSPGEGQELVGVWVGHLGAGPEKVTLTFSAQEGGRFQYTLQAGGQEETSDGDWAVDNSSLILKHPDGEIENIPFSVEGNVLRWSDEDLGALELIRDG